jgi:hypothetical protein
MRAGDVFEITLIPDGEENETVPRQVPKSIPAVSFPRTIRISNPKSNPKPVVVPLPNPRILPTLPFFIRMPWLEKSENGLPPA